MFLIKKGKDSHLLASVFYFYGFYFIPRASESSPGAGVLWGNSGVTALSAHPRSSESLGLLPVALLMTFFVSPNHPRGFLRDITAPRGCSGWGWRLLNTKKVKGEEEGLVLGSPRQEVRPTITKPPLPHPQIPKPGPRRHHQAPGNGNKSLLSNF